MFSLRYFLCVTLLCAVAPGTSFAAVDYVKSPHVREGMLNLEYHGSRTGDDGKAQNNDQEHEIEAYYGVTDYLKLGAEMELVNEPGESLKAEVSGVNATLQTTKQGDWWLSSGIFGFYGLAHDDADPDEAKVILLAQRKQGRFNFLGNLGLEEETGPKRAGGAELFSALNGTYSMRSYFKPGVEWHAQYGKLNHTSSRDNQEHYVGPIATGNLFETKHGELEYEIGYFWGLTDASADNAQRISLEYEYRF